MKEQKSLKHRSAIKGTSGVTTPAASKQARPLQELRPKDFVHLHNHTQYSLLDGLTKVPPLIESVKKMGMNAVAITDHGTMSGVIEFYKTAKSSDIKPQSYWGGYEWRGFNDCKKKDEA